ncbi:Glutamyl-tRNA(Gln) amidotransferase subunit C [Rubripirellula amarantea]|uniref:Aspartyl/glutamyl-tRNA(Asn/Gln) amidotransferase subunit C n=1 Tax=Rubripirellula amarantea TaxID=2527999 RepID=A0A5C5WQE5_9BACT|nr:Asp-tRNA(Asn)/Glu-tRNA(Gln) amidotransferase subunit GatC [Rubripirellula amarantea]TWT53006.1 Glutamyl-tRNA(Gln) amidotransferase subunit C [Rubripirellula amarantea]
MSLSNDDVAKLALLARLELSAAEVESVRPQLESILGFVHKLSELDTDNVEPMTTALDVDNCWRADESVASLDRKDALANAPSTDDEYFLVPPVLGSAAAKH